MNQHVKIDRVEITGPDGLHQEYLIQKRMLFISCDLDGKIDLEPGPGPVQKTWRVQAIAKPGHCLLANVGCEPIRLQETTTGAPSNPTLPLQQNGAKICSPEAVEAVPYDRPLELNGFRIIFHRKRVARSMAVDFLLPEPELRCSHTPHMPLEGRITLSNTGSQTHIQFHVKVKADDLPAPAFHVESPHPKLAFTQDRVVKLFIYHPVGHPLPAGHYCLEVSAEANEYPGQVATDFQELHVRPFYDYDLEFSTPSPCREEKL